MNKDKPILFSGAMVRAILSGDKTMTRRVIKLNGTEEIIDGMLWRPDMYGDWHPIMDYCPYHNHMNLWVRETWAPISPDEYRRPIEECNIEYRADTPNAKYPGEWPEDEAKGNDDAPKWRPSIFMPRWASRITLEVTGVKVERVRDITDDDAIQEGVDRTNTSIPTYAIQRFQKLWDSINGKREGCSWADNPWTWAISFRRVD